MDSTSAKNNEKAWLHGNFDEVISRLEREEYAGMELLSDEDFITLQVRLSKNREELLVFLRLLDRYFYCRRSRPLAEPDPRFERFVVMAPILRRDAMMNLSDSSKGA
jgi:hypothetical protein